MITMTDKFDHENDQNPQLEANKVNIKLRIPEINLCTSSAIVNILHEDARFNYLVAQLEPKGVKNILDTIILTKFFFYRTNSVLRDFP